MRTRLGLCSHPQHQNHSTRLSTAGGACTGKCLYPEGPIKWYPSPCGRRSYRRGLNPAQVWGQEVGEGLLNVSLPVALPLWSVLAHTSRPRLCHSPRPGCLPSVKGTFPFSNKVIISGFRPDSPAHGKTLGLSMTWAPRRRGHTLCRWKGDLRAQTEGGGGRGPLENEDAIPGTAASSSFLTTEPTGFLRSWSRSSRLVIKLLPVDSRYQPCLLCTPHPSFASCSESVYQQGLHSLFPFSHPLPELALSCPLRSTKPGSASLCPESPAAPVPWEVAASAAPSVPPTPTGPL